MNGKSVREIPIVPRFADDKRMTREQYDALMTSPSGGQMDMYQTASVADTVGQGAEPAKKKSKKSKVDHDKHDDCFCEQPISEEEATADEHLPASTGGVEGDA